jgi:hypothetical protein
MSGGVRGKEHEWSHKAQDGVKMQLHGQFEKPDYVILSVDCRVFEFCQCNQILMYLRVYDSQSIGYHNRNPHLLNPPRD